MRFSRKIRTGLKVEFEHRRLPGRPLPHEVGVRITNLRSHPKPRTLRLHASAGTTPGRRRGYWRTGVGKLHGHNLLIGSPISPHSLTFLAHLRNHEIGA